MDKWEEGRHGENVIRGWLKAKNLPFFQADLLFKSNGKWYVAEVKYQEAFEPPPFKGHGLPLWQVDARLAFQEQTDIRAILFVVDKDTGIIYWQYLDELRAGDSFLTEKTKRLIFPLENYRMLQRAS